MVDEQALADAILKNQIAGAAFDVFEKEPATDSPLFNIPNVVVTPHLGAATSEAQENVAIQIAEQMSEFLLKGAVSNALNMPSVTAEEALVMHPWLKLAENLGAFTGQMTEEPILQIQITYNGVLKNLNLDALNCVAIAGIMKVNNAQINMVSAPVIAKERGINISTITQDKSGSFDGYIKINVVTETREKSVAGTVFSDGKPRFIQIKGINIDAEIGENMIYTTNKDLPGIIGILGKTLGDNKINIANFTLGRASIGGEAIALLSVDGSVSSAAIIALKETNLFQQVKSLTCLLYTSPSPRD